MEPLPKKNCRYQWCGVSYREVDGMGLPAFLLCTLLLFPTREGGGMERHVLGKEKRPATKDWTGQGSSLQISRPTSDRQTDSLLSQHDLLELSSPSVLCVWVSLASQDLETSDSFIAHFASLLCLILNYHISDFSSLWLTTLSYDRLESLYKYFLFYAENNTLLHKFHGSDCSLWLHIRVCVWKRNKASNIYFYAIAKVC